MLDNFVFFALPLILIFYPTKVEDKDTKVEGKDSASPGPSAEEICVVTLFGVFASLWILGVLLSTFGRGRKCLKIVACLTYLSVLSIVAFVIFALSKTMPEDWS